MKQNMTLSEIRQTGIDLLTSHLGITGMIRFFQQAEIGMGDYTQERKQWLEKTDMDVKTLAEVIMKQRNVQKH